MGSAKETDRLRIGFPDTLKGSSINTGRFAAMALGSDPGYFG